MYKDILRTMDAEALRAALTLAVFFVFFLMVVLDAWRKSNSEIKHLEDLPLDDSTS